MRRIKLTITYDGTAYHGWQIQPNADTVQERVERAVFMLTGERVTVVGSGRTDAGVHALAQTAHFDTDSNIPTRNFFTGLNNFLPLDVRVLAAEEVSGDFHARFSAKEKTYRYYLYESDVELPMLLNRAVAVKGNLDIEKMKEAAKVFIGKHDFRSFQSTGADTVTSVRTIKRLTVKRERGFVVISVTADGFLYNMVRIITGTLVDAAFGLYSPGDISAVLEAKDRTRAGKTAPPDGLYLAEVEYPTPFDWKTE